MKELIGKLRIFFRKLLPPIALRIRLLPIVIGCATLMLAFRIYDIKTLVEGSEELFGISELNAEPAAQAIQPKKSSLVKQTDNQDVFDPFNLTAEEVRVLETLSDRKRELEKREASLNERQQVLNSLEERVNSKIDELKTLKSKIEDIVKAHDESEDAKLKSLIKIYETMKSKDAARLFSKMKLDVLLRVLGRMKEGKAAAIMGKMEATVARVVTEELAYRQELTDEAREQIQQKSVEG